MKKIRILLTAVSGIYIIFASQSGLDRMSRTIAPLEELVWEPFRAEAERARTTLALLQGKAGPALKAASKAVETDPYNPDTTALLGAANLVDGRRKEGERAFRIAAQFGWRNLFTQSYWYQAALAAKDYKVAVDRADAILRTNPLLAELPASLDGLETVPEGVDILAKRLEGKPPWLTAYTRVRSQTPKPLVSQRYKVIAQVDPAKAGWACETLSTLVSTLVEQGRREEGQNLWNAHCPKLRSKGFLTDPEFSNIFSDTGMSNPFGWKIVQSGDTSIEPVAPQGVVVSNDGASSRIVMYQPTSLPKGIYRIKVEGRTKLNVSVDGISVIWTCKGKERFHASQLKNSESIGQVVQTGACSDQRIEIWVSPGSGNISLSNIAITKIS